MKRFLFFLGFLFLLASCGSPKTVVRVKNNATDNQTEISVQQGDGGSTTVDIHTKLDSIKVL